MYQLITIRYAWLRVHHDIPSSIETFNKNVYVITYGDDNCYTVSWQYKSIFTESAIGQIYKELGLKYTSDDKGLTKDVMRNISQIGFLKRAFLFSTTANRYVAPLQLQTIKEMVYWYRDGSSMHNNITQVVETAISEFSLHGRDVFTKHVPVLLDAYKSTQLPCVKNSDWLRNFRAVLERTEFY
jgi:hypothetical protein